MSSEQPPTDRQLRYLRNLAAQRGESFSYPQSRARASAEIERLKRRRQASYVERRIEDLQVSREISALGDCAAVKADEVTGYGSSARWR